MRCCLNQVLMLCRIGPRHHPNHQTCNFMETEALKTQAILIMPHHEQKVYKTELSLQRLGFHKITSLMIRVMSLAQFYAASKHNLRCSAKSQLLLPLRACLITNRKFIRGATTLSRTTLRRMTIRRTIAKQNSRGGQIRTLAPRFNCQGLCHDAGQRLKRL